MRTWAKPCNDANLLPGDLQADAEGDEILRRPKEIPALVLIWRYALCRAAEEKKSVCSRTRNTEDRQRVKKKKLPQEKAKWREIQRIYAILSNPGWVSMAGNTSKIRFHWSTQREPALGDQCTGIKRGRKTDTAGEAERGFKAYWGYKYTLQYCTFNDSVSYRRQWNEIPKAVKTVWIWGVILADKKGNITEL